jgi:hypothetical protein
VFMQAARGSEASSKMIGRMGFSSAYANSGDALRHWT